MADNSAPAEQCATAELARFLAAARYESIPDDVLTRTKHLILDGLGCAMFGAKLEGSRRAVEALRELDGEGSATVWGWPHKAPPTTAALLNGAFVHAYELDDYHAFGPLHSGACVLPAALATAEQVGAVSGRQFLLASTLGFEVGPRIGMAMGGVQLVNRGWHCGAIYGVLSAVSAAGKLRNLDSAEFEDAIGIAATQASGLIAANRGSMVKRMHMGMAARSGVVGASLASKGFTGIKQVLDLEYGGLLSTFCRDDPYDLSVLTAGLGEDWEVRRISIKPAFCTMTGIHSSIEAALALRDAPGFDISSIESIQIGVAEAMFHHGGWQLSRPAKVISAQMNYAYAVAVTLLDGAPSVPQFSEERINRDDVWQVLPSIAVHRDPEVESWGDDARWGARMEVTFTNGKKEEIAVRHAKGHYLRPHSNEEIGAKYDLMTSYVMDRSDAEQLKHVVLNLEQFSSIIDLAKSLSIDVASPLSD